MLRIDRVHTEMELLPPAPRGSEVVGPDRQELRRLVLEILRDELSDLERRGAL
jgi:hypothetical protein